MTPDRETQIRVAVAAAGYGDGFAINLPAESLSRYATQPHVAAHL